MAPQDPSDRPSPEGMRFTVEPPSTSPPCAYCFQRVDQSVGRVCPRCRATYHPDCLRANSDRCAIYGCEPAAHPPVAAPGLVRPAPPEPPFRPRRSGISWAFVGIAGMMLAQGAIRLTLERPSSPSNPHKSRGWWQQDPVLLQRLAELEEVRTLYQETAPFLWTLDQQKSLPQDREARQRLRFNVDQSLQKLKRARLLLLANLAAGPPPTLTVDPNLLADQILRLERLSAELSGP